MPANRTSRDLLIAEAAASILTTTDNFRLFQVSTLNRPNLITMAAGVSPIIQLSSNRRVEAIVVLVRGTDAVSLQNARPMLSCPSLLIIANIYLLFSEVQRSSSTGPKLPLLSVFEARLSPPFRPSRSAMRTPVAE